MVLATFVSWTAIITSMVLALCLMDGHNRTFIVLAVYRLVHGHDHIYGLSDLSSHGRP
jgi:hypothetical protein